MTILVRTSGHESRPQTSRAAKGKAKRGRSLWWVVHSWLGLKLALFMTWVLLTGTLAVFSVEMDWLARPALRATPQAAPLASWGTLYETARRTLPDADIDALYLGPHPWFATEALAVTPGKVRVRVYLNPYDGRRQGIGEWRSFQRFFREMHRHLLLPARWGIPIVCSLSMLLLLSLVTGLVSYKKFWRGFFRMPRLGDGRRLAGDLHRLGGLWALWFVVLIALTGFWYLVEALGGAAPSHGAPEATRAAVRRLDKAEIDRFAAVALRAYPDLEIHEMRLPGKGGDPIGFFGQADAVMVRDRSNGVWIDPADGHVIEVLKGEALTVHQRISEMADPLHFGTWGGMVTKAIWFLFGAVLTALSVTGAIIYTLRLKTAYAGRAATAALVARRSGPVARAWRGMGMWAYPAAGLVLLSLALIPGWLAK